MKKAPGRSFRFLVFGFWLTRNLKLKTRNYEFGMWVFRGEPQGRTFFNRLLRYQDGFTLLEAAIAMTLLVLITTVLYGGFYLSHRAMESWQVHAEESQRVRAVEDFLGSYIRSAYPYRLTPRDQAVVFSGEESRLTFVSAISAGMGGRGLAKVSLYWESDQDRTGLLALEEEIPMRWESQD